MTILRMRAKAQEKLKDKFDIKAFHDAVLDGGPMPLSVLEQRLNDWIARPVALLRDNYSVLILIYVKMCVIGAFAAISGYHRISGPWASLFAELTGVQVRKCMVPAKAGKPWFRVRLVKS